MLGEPPRPPDDDGPGVPTVAGFGPAIRVLTPLPPLVSIPGASDPGTDAVGPPPPAAPAPPPPPPRV